MNSWKISDELLEWINNNIKKGATILELGSGEGTNELLKNYKVYSVEHDKKYLNKTKSNYIHAPIKRYKGYKWFSEFKVPYYDVLLIDAPPEVFGRLGMIKHFDMFDLSKLIILDDTHRLQEQIVLEKLIELMPDRKIIEIKSKYKKSTVIW